MPRSNKYEVFPKIHSRQLGFTSPMSILNAARGSTDFIKRLGKWRVLTGHQGCVNTIAWNESGDKILSGSDDCHLNIYDVGKHKLLESIRSGHRANIFSARFLPASSDRKIVSCCGGGMVHYNEVGFEIYHGQNYFNCHSGTTYELTVIPGDPNSFLTCGEDGTIRHFDLRVKSNCYCQECRDDILIERPNAITSIMVNPVMPYHLAVGCEDSFVRIYDMRAICTERERSNLWKSTKHDSGVITLLKPPDLKKASCRVTSLRYNETGSEILVSYCTDYVYLFSTNIQKRATCSALGNGKALRNRVNGVPSEDSSRSLPPVKRLRLRGDWSDTGPNARPENEQDREENNTNSLMQRISDVFSRWLEDSFNESANQSNSQGGTNEGGDDHESIPGPGTAGNTDQSASSPQPEAFDNSEVVECTVMNEPLKDDDINPVEDMVEILDLDGSETGDSMSHLHVGSGEKTTDGVLDEVVNNDCDVEESAPLLDIVQNQEEKTNFVAETLINNEGEFNNSVEAQQTLIGRQQLCACGSDEGLFEESCSVCPSSSLNSNKASCVINGNAAPCTLPLNEAQFEEQSTSLIHPKEEKRTASCEMNTDTLVDYGESISPNSTNSQSSSLLLSEDLGIAGDSDGILDSQNSLEVKRRRKLADDSKLYSSTENSSACRESDDSIIASEHNKITAAEGKDANEIELVGTTERNLNCRTTRDCEYGKERLSNCNSNDNRKTTAEGMYNIDENLGYVESVLAVDGSKDLNSKRSSSVNIDAEKEDNSKSDTCEALISKNDKCETVVSKNSLSNRGTDCEEAYGMKLSRVSMDCSSHEKSLDDDESAENASADNHITEVDRLERPGTSNESSARELPSATCTNVTSSTRIGPLRDLSARRRHAAATRIQRCFRLQKKKNETSADSEEDMMHNFDMPTPLMCYKGHRNARTMIKEANFWGDRYVVSGSDCGRVFIWDKKSGDLVVLLEGDKHVVNCVQPHPFDPILATSGIDYDIKVWAPVLESPAVLTNVEEIISRNEQMLEESRDTITVPASFMLRMLASLSRVRGQRRSQQQDESNSNDDSDD